MVVTRLLGRAARLLGRTPARAAGAGVAGGVLLDDVPFGSEIDPTEGGGSNPLVLLLVGVVVALGALLLLDEVLPP